MLRARAAAGSDARDEGLGGSRHQGVPKGARHNFRESLTQWLCNGSKLLAPVAGVWDRASLCASTLAT